MDVRISRSPLSFYADWYRSSAGLHAERKKVPVLNERKKPSSINLKSNNPMSDELS